MAFFRVNPLPGHFATAMRITDLPNKNLALLAESESTAFDHDVFLRLNLVLRERIELSILSYQDSGMPFTYRSVERYCEHSIAELELRVNHWLFDL